MSHPVELSEAARAALVKLRHARDQITYFRKIEEETRAVIEAELGDAHDAATLDQLVAIRDKAMERSHHELDKFTELGLSSLDDATAAAHLGRAGVLYDLAGQLAGVITNIRQEQEK